MEKRATQSQNILQRQACEWDRLQKPSHTTGISRPRTDPAAQMFQPKGLRAEVWLSTWWQEEVESYETQPVEIEHHESTEIADQLEKRLKKKKKEKDELFFGPMHINSWPRDCLQKSKSSYFN